MARLLLRVVVAAAVLTLVALGGRHVPEALARVDTFRATHHEFRGLRFLTGDTVLQVAGIGPEANLWEDPAAWEQRLEAHPLVRHASVGRRFPGTLTITVEERTPVGLVPRPTLEPVDRDGRALPLDPSRFPLDYPILRPGSLEGEGDEGSTVQLRALAAAAETIRQEGEFWSGVSEVRPGPHGGFEVFWGQPTVLFRLAGPVELRRIREGMAALEDARKRAPGRSPLSVDLRFDDLVILGWEGAS
jgi:hypothetical protein